MLKGNVQEKRGYLHTVISYKDENGVRKKKWQSTGLTAKGNIRKAEAILKERMEILHATKEDLLSWCDVLDVHAKEAALRAGQAAAYLR